MLLNTKKNVKRSGMILLIVVAFLSMFLVVGTTYLLVADSIRRTSEFDLNATDKRSDFALMPDIDPRYMFNFALGQILYDVVDPVIVGTKVVTTNSALRGHSLARSIYGGYNAAGGNDRPFQGSGKTNAELGQANYIVNIPSGSPVPVPAIVNPEKGSTPSRWNPPYTYPDKNHLYLGSYTLKTDGTTLPIKPSFFFDNATNLRPTLPNNPPDFDGYDVKNLEGYPGGNDSIWIDAGFPVMTTPDGRKYKALIAPLILDLDGRINLNVAGNLMQRDAANPNFTADHASNQGWGRWEINPKKLIENYSVLNPPGSPSGSPYNPLNITQTPSLSSDPIVPENEFLHLLSFTVPSTEPGTTGVTNPPTVPKPPNSSKSAALNSTFAVDNQWRTFGRYTQAKYLPINSSTTPINNNNPSQTSNFNFVQPHSYAQVDFNAAGEPGTWGGTAKPTFVNTNGFPTFGQGFGNGYAYEFDPTTKLPILNMMTNNPSVLSPNEHFLETANPLTTNYHARNFNPYRTQSSANGISTVFPVSETASILRWQGKGEPYSKSQLAQLLPKSLGLDMPYESASSTSNSVNKIDGIFRQRIRNMVTTLSADLDRPAMVPIAIDAGYSVILPAPPDPPNNDPNNYPRTNAVDTLVSVPNSTTPPLKLDLNRVVRNFPKYNANNTHYNLNGPGDDPSKTAQQEITFAETDRRILAQDIYNTLRNVTAFNGVNIKTNKWFAQLAVNIVDYIDNDDFSTAWQYDGVNWVFGVEMPRLVINEVYVQVKNNKMDDFKVNNQPTKSRATKDYDVNTYIELKNPLPLDPASIYDQKPGSHKAIVQYNDGTNDNLVFRLVMNKRGVFWKEPDVVPPPAPVPPMPRIQPTFFEKINELGNPYGLIDYLDMADPNKYTILDIKKLSKWNGGGDKVIDANSYFVVSSQLDFKANDKANPTIIPNLQTADLNYTLAKDKKFTGDDFPVVLLQKLPRPWLLENNNAADVNFNPFVTIDVNHTTIRKKVKVDPVTMNPILDPITMKPVLELDPDTSYPVPDTTDPFYRAIVDRREFDDAKDYDTATEMNPNFVIDANIKSIQRQTPFLDAGVVSDYFNSPPYVPTNKYFYNGKNSTLKSITMPTTILPLNNNNNNNNLPWFTFLDRQLINPLELIHVPCCKPHELTQMATRWGDSVVQGGVTTFPYAHNWPWFDENTRLYRFLEAVGVSPLQAGEAMHGRALGKVNVNTMHSEEVFQAVADAAPANNFTAGDLNTVGDVKTGYGKLVSQLPILSFGQANYTAGMVKYGLNRSLMGYTDGNKPNENILDVASFNAAGPNVATYARKELLTKIGNSVTTKSNVFAVWITTGYFEVIDDSVQPPNLGAEIGKADGINIRHRMFAIVDRTNMVNAKKTDLAVVFTSNVNGLMQDTNGNPLNPINFGKPVLINPANNANINLVNGMTVTIDANTDYEETVSVVLDGNGDFLFTPQKLHSPIYMPAIGPNPAYYQNTIKTIINRGNPGPWVGYDRTKDREVVPYAEIIE
jgi:hypothetical protein